MAAVSAPSRDIRRAPGPVRRLRVAHVVTQLVTGAGGITLRGAQGLDSERYSTTILAAAGGSLIEKTEDAGIAVVPLHHMAGGRGIYPRSDLQGFRELCSQLAAGGFDIVHTHSAKAGGIGRLAARRVGVPAVVHSFHGFPFHAFQPLPVRRALITIERRLGAITDYFLTDGTVVAADAVRLKIAPPDRIRAIASPIDNGIAPATPETRRRARAALGIPAGARVVGTAARLDHQKSPLDMVEAIAALGQPDVHMVWIGDGHLRSRTERLIERKGLTGRFLLLGDRADVPELLPAFDVFAMSSLYEGLPCAVVEAMTAGIPVVATAVNSVPEIVISGRTGLLARPRDPASLSRALAYMLEHPDDGARMAEAARAHIGDGFRPEVLGRDLMQSYAIALRAAGARGRGGRR
jgi:glycosyltransferase involved in cell wall biosynthesis